MSRLLDSSRLPSSAQLPETHCRQGFRSAVCSRRFLFFIILRPFLFFHQFPSLSQRFPGFRDWSFFFELCSALPWGFSLPSLTLASPRINLGSTLVCSCKFCPIKKRTAPLLLHFHCAVFKVRVPNAFAFQPDSYSLSLPGSLRS